MKIVKVELHHIFAIKLQKMILLLRFFTKEHYVEAMLEEALLLKFVKVDKKQTAINAFILKKYSS